MSLFTLPLTEKRSEFHQINFIVAIIYHYHLPGNIQCSKNRLKVSLRNFGMQNKRILAPSGNRTQGKCLEGIYVTTTPMVLLLLSVSYQQIQSFILMTLTSFIFHHISNKMSCTCTNKQHSFMYKSLITSSLSLALIIVSEPVSCLIADNYVSSSLHVWL